MAAVALGTAIAPRANVRGFVVAGVVCAVLPDVDAIGRVLPWTAADVAWLGGHRGFTHSLTYAAACGAIAPLVTLASARWNGVRLRLGLYVALATASHGVVDTLTSIGAATSPVQFLSPFDTTGYVSSWQPIHGPFSELFILLLPLVAAARIACYVRGIPWPRRAAREAVTLDLS
jgi:inner membrane protein